MKRTRTEVAIIGAGITGLSAARRLADEGVTLRVFDKARGPGGRASTRRTDDTAFDHGAQYFTARDPRFRPCVEDWVEREVAAPWPGEIVVLGREGQSDLREERLRYVGVPGMSALARDLTDGLEVETLARVESIQRDGDAWALFDERGTERLRASAVLVTTPPVQAIPLLASAPDVARSLEGIELSACWAVMARFDAPLPVPFDGAFVHDHPLSWVARNSSKPGRPSAEAWVLHASPEWSEEHLERAPDTVAAELMAAFFQRVDVAPRAPALLAAHRWRYAQAPGDRDREPAWDAKMRIGAGGDWCRREGRIEGAYLSGLELARHVLETAV